MDVQLSLRLLFIAGFSFLLLSLVSVWPVLSGFLAYILILTLLTVAEIVTNITIFNILCFAAAVAVTTAMVFFMSKTKKV